MVDSIWGGMPSYISGMFKNKKKPFAPDAAPVARSARDTPEAIANLGRQFNALMSEGGTGADEPMPKESFGSKVGRGVAGFLGFVPKGGTRGDAADGWANIGRALMGENSVQQMESDYNDSIAPEKRRRALDTGDIETIKRVDPQAASQVQGVDDTSYKSQRQRQFDDAVASGDTESVRRLDPAAADERDTVRRAAAFRAARAASEIGAQDPARGAAALQQFAKESPNLFSPQELQAYEQGGPRALEAILTGEGAQKNKDRFLNVGGGLFDMDNETWVEPQTKDVTERELLELDLLRARVGAAGRSNRGTSNSNRGTSESDSESDSVDAQDSFSGALNNISGTAVKLARSGAIGVGGKGAPKWLQSFAVGVRNTDGSQTPLSQAATLFGNDTAELFNERATQVAFATRQFAMAADIGTGSLNSNFELQNVQTALGDPFGTMETQIAASDAMSLTYGDGIRTSDFLLQNGSITEAEYDAIVRKTEGFTGNIERGVERYRARGDESAEQVVRVKTAEEAQALPPGTVFLTPDGRRKVR